MTTAEPVLLFDKPADGVARLTINRPDVLNAMNMAVRDELWLALQAVRDDPDVRVALFRGAGERAFSSGADVSEFGTAPSYVESRRARADRDVWGLMLSIMKPLVAAIHGYAYGAGCELSLLCDIRIAADDARFGLPEVTLGYIPSAGGTQTLPRAVPPGVAREIVLSGEPIDARRALAVGLVNRVVPRAQLDDEALAVANKLASLPADAVRAAKEAMVRGAELPLDRGLRLEELLGASFRRQTAGE
ncbi:MAG: enoyl-CoA hydratase/isomerase family protein [Dehalococcoidia bacterium]|nr:MAG: enoyl-CoA hydratase/isomerase family protein [Dehalococcoidia bacterium]